ncbi:MAG TPA: hypothetical protein VLM38_14560 [Blastocatellia bacterium]|nr:hypothetical protein [Blastocatellia bacterium]
MRIVTLPILLLVLASFAHEATTGDKVELGEEFKIKNGQEVVLRGEKIRVRFKSVREDSRCPTGVACVWAGNAKIGIEVAKKKTKQLVATLNTSLEPRQIEYKGFKIKLVALTPYPNKEARIDPKEYEAVLVVTK